jgi:hypothetical protein
MNANMGTVDRVVRFIVAIAFAALYFTGTVTGILGIILLAVSGIFIATSFLSFCPLYTVLGFNTCPKKS